MGAISNYDVIVFDVEDSLIDQTVSLPMAISRAVDAYLVNLVGVKPEGGPVFTRDEVKTFNEQHGFDTDFDALHALLTLALHTLSEEFQEDDFGGYDGRDLLDAVRASGRIQDSLGELAKRKNFQEFNKMLRQRGGKRGFARIRGLRNRWMALAEGHIMMDNLVRRILAEVYLGEELFHKEYGQDRQFAKDEGVIQLETCWVDPDDMLQIRKRCALAAVTSRSQAEGQYVLGHVGIGSLFDVVVSADAMGPGMADLEEVSWIRSLGVGGAAAADYSTRVIDAIERTRAQEGIDTIMRVAYVGNCAADGRGLGGLKDRYRLTVMGCAFGADKKVLPLMKEKGADVVIAEPPQLLRYLSERPRVRSSDY